MLPDHAALRIQATRFHARFEALARIGATPEGGVHRPTFSPAHQAARAWFRAEAQALDLDVRRDAAGNLSARWPCGTPEARTLMLGSHLDSVVQGGRFDGALGVVAALEVLHTLKEAGVALPFHLEVMDFTDEEGTYVSLLGSRAVAGLLADDLAHPHGGSAAFDQVLAGVGLDRTLIPEAKRDGQTLAGYLEIHIEQGLRLVRAEAEVGIVTGMVGIQHTEVTFRGEANHAGTTPMTDRRDAALGAAAFVLAVPEVTRTFGPEARANVGRLHLAPGAFNIIPETATLALECRAPEPDQLDALVEALATRAREIATQYTLEVTVPPFHGVRPRKLDPGIQSAFQAAVGVLGVNGMSMTSGAGHDPQSMVQICPAGMIFVPSVGGVSHTPREYSTPEDCERGANVLLHAVLHLAHNHPR